MDAGKKPKDKREAEKLLYDAKIYAALHAIDEVGKCFDEGHWWNDKIADSTIEDLQTAVDDVIERLLDRKQKRARRHNGG